MGFDAGAAVPLTGNTGKGTGKLPLVPRKTPGAAWRRVPHAESPVTHRKTSREGEREQLIGLLQAQERAARPRRALRSGNATAFAGAERNRDGERDWSAEGSEHPPGVTSQTEGGLFPPAAPRQRRERHAPKLRATPVPRCVMDIAMGSDHLQEKRGCRRQGGARRGPGRCGRCCSRSYSRNPERAGGGECAEAAGEWQMPPARARRGAGGCQGSFKGDGAGADWEAPQFGDKGVESGCPG